MENSGRIVGKKVTLGMKTKPIAKQENSGVQRLENIENIDAHSSWILSEWKSITKQKQQMLTKNLSL